MISFTYLHSRCCSFSSVRRPDVAVAAVQRWALDWEEKGNVKQRTVLEVIILSVLILKVMTLARMNSIQLEQLPYQF